MKTLIISYILISISFFLLVRAANASNRSQDQGIPKCSTKISIVYNQDGDRKSLKIPINEYDAISHNDDPRKNIERCQEYAQQGGYRCYLVSSFLNKYIQATGKYQKLHACFGGI